MRNGGFLGKVSNTLECLGLWGVFGWQWNLQVWGKVYCQSEYNSSICESWKWEQQWVGTQPIPQHIINNGYRSELNSRKMQIILHTAAIAVLFKDLPGAQEMYYQIPLTFEQATYSLVFKIWGLMPADANRSPIVHPVYLNCKLLRAVLSYVFILSGKSFLILIEISRRYCNENNYNYLKWDKILVSNWNWNTRMDVTANRCPPRSRSPLYHRHFKANKFSITAFLNYPKK